MSRCCILGIKFIDNSLFHVIYFINSHDKKITFDDNACFTLLEDGGFPAALFQYLSSKTGIDINELKFHSEEI